MVTATVPVTSRRLLVMGASGSGTTTLARAIADAWSVPHADADDYFWVPTDPPYVKRREEAERVALMWAMFAPRDAWVLSGSVMGWGEEVAAQVDTVVFCTLAPEVRMERLRAREAVRYRDRIGPGGDREASFAAFLDWAAGYDDPNFDGRSRVQHDQWLAELGKPVLYADTTRTTRELVADLLGSPDLRA